MYNFIRSSVMEVCFFQWKKIAFLFIQKFILNNIHSALTNPKDNNNLFAYEQLKVHRDQLRNSFALVTNHEDKDILYFWKLMQLRFCLQDSIYAVVTNLQDTQNFVK